MIQARLERGAGRVTRIVIRAIGAHDRGQLAVRRPYRIGAVSSFRRLECRWHVSRNRLPSMSTVLLVGDLPPSAARLSDSESPATRPTSALKGALERVGYRVMSAADGAGALARLGPHPPDAIVL